MKQNEFLEIIEQNKGKHRQPVETLIQGRKNKLFDSEKSVETRLVAKFNVIDTSSATNIMNSEAISQFSEIEIDGVIQSSVVATYQFNIVGDHSVKYTLKDETSIGGGTFENCTSLTSATIGNGVTTIGTNAFGGCTSLTNVIIPNSVTSIGNTAFAACSGLTTITIPDSVTSIGMATFTQCTGLTSITIGSGVTNISMAAFYGCSSLTSITIPNTVTTIDTLAFQNCSALTSITIPDSVTTISGGAFSNCNGLTSVTIGSGVTSISQGAFYSCINLSTITSHIMNAPSAGYGTFSGVKNGGTLYVPIGSSGYETWMNNQNLGAYNWTKVEQ